MKNRGLKNLSLALLSTTVMIPAVAAQEAEPIVSVYERNRTDLSPEGIRSGSFLIRPTIAVEGQDNSNIYANAAEEDDFIAVIKPALRIDSNWNNNAFAIFADAKIGRYSDNGTEDYEDFRFGSTGRLDISRGSNIFYDLTYSRGHEDRGSADPQSQLAPTVFSSVKAIAGYKRDEGILSFALDGSYEKRDFDDVGVSGQAGFLENDKRDREIKQGSIRLGYELNPEYEAFVKFTGVKVDYDTPYVGNGVNRSNDGWDAVGGVAFRVGGSSEGEVYGGYVKRVYDADKLKEGNIGDFKFGGSLLWTSGLSSLKLGVDRSVLETALSDSGVPAAGILNTSFSGRVEHELRRNLLLSASARFSKMDFQGDTITREDDVINLATGLKYLWNRNLSMDASYRFEKRNASNDTFDYDRHSFMVNLSAQW